MYGIPTILGRAINFLLIILYSGDEVFEVGEYGVVTEMYAFVAFLNILFQFGMETTYFRWTNKVDEKQTFRTTVSFIFLVCTLLGGLIVLLATPITNSLNYPGCEEYVYLLTLTICLDAITAIPFARLRHFQKAKKFAAIKFLNIGINVFLNIFFLKICEGVYNGDYLVSMKPFVSSFYNPEFKVRYVFVANVIASSIVIPFLFKEFLGFRFYLNKQLLQPMLKFAIPLVVVGTAGMVNETIDRILLKQLLPNGFDGNSNQEVVSIYGAAYKLSIFMTLVIQAFRYAAEPFFFSKAKDKKSPELFAKIMKWFIIACAFIFVGVSLERHFIGTIFLRQVAYHEGLIVVPILLLANLFLGTYYNQSIWYKLTEKTRYGSIISIIGAVVTIALNIALIPILGYMGSAITTLVCYFLMSMISYIWGQKHYPIPYDLKNAFFYIITSTIIVAGSYFIKFDNFWVQFVVMGLIFAGYVAFTIFIERKSLQAILKRKKSE